jgi:hypothetical protein
VWAHGRPARERARPGQGRCGERCCAGACLSCSNTAKSAGNSVSWRCRRYRAAYYGREGGRGGVTSWKPRSQDDAPPATATQPAGCDGKLEVWAPRPPARPPARAARPPHLLAALRRGQQRRPADAVLVQRAPQLHQRTWRVARGHEAEGLVHRDALARAGKSGPVLAARLAALRTGGALWWGGWWMQVELAARPMAARRRGLGHARGGAPARCLGWQSRCCHSPCCRRAPAWQRRGAAAASRPTRRRRRVRRRTAWQRRGCWCAACAEARPRLSPSSPGGRAGRGCRQAVRRRVSAQRTGRGSREPAMGPLPRRTGGSHSSHMSMKTVERAAARLPS